MEKTKALHLMALGACFKYVSAHDSLILLRYSLAILRLKYMLQTAPCCLSSELALYNDTLQEILGSVTNTLLAEDDQAWLQARLPVKLGGLGIHRATQIAPSAYLASVATSADLVCAISSTSHHSLPNPFIDVVLAQGSKDHILIPSQDAAACQQ